MLTETWGTVFSARINRSSIHFWQHEVNKQAVICILLAKILDQKVCNQMLFFFWSHRHKQDVTEHISFCTYCTAQGNEDVV